MSDGGTVSNMRQVGRPMERRTLAEQQEIEARPRRTLFERMADAQGGGLVSNTTTVHPSHEHIAAAMGGRYCPTCRQRRHDRSCAVCGGMTK